MPVHGGRFALCVGIVTGVILSVGVTARNMVEAQKCFKG
jgi:hypothetical protein